MRLRLVLRLTFYAILAYAVYSFFFPSLRLRYKLMLEVEVAGNIYHSSSIVDVVWRLTPSRTAAVGTLYGHCPSIDLGSSGLLFVVNSIPFLRGPDYREPVGFSALYPAATQLQELPLAVYRLQPSRANYALAFLSHQEVSGTLVGQVPVPLDRLPMIVRFRNINDPATMEELDPKDISPAYGPGSRIVSATLEVTDEGMAPPPPNWPSWIAQDGEQTLKVAVPIGKASAPIKTAYRDLMIRQLTGF